jgi:phospholipid-binding lipoprotein MlaA
MPSIRRIILLLLVCLAFGTHASWAAQSGDGAAAQPESVQAEVDWTELDEDDQELEVWDPLEPFNRGMFWFNDKLYFYLLKPVAKGYRFVAPEPVRESVGNFFVNLAAPVRVLNSLLQGKGTEAAAELSLFMINSTWGIAGLFDLTPDDMTRPDAEDFGQTLGHYGTPSGFYLVLPVFGPSNTRDAVGLVADSLTHPVPSPFYLKMKPLEVAGIQTYDTVNELSLDKDTYEAIKQDALDPYLFVRNAFMQKRAAKVEK